LEAATGVRLKLANLSTIRPEVFPHATTFSANSTVGMLITHSRVALRVWNVKFRLLTTQATSGGSNSNMVCHDCAMMLARPLAAVVSSTTGPGSSRR
jgi:hypothetical protein